MEWRHERSWLEALPRLAGECAERWGLELEQPVDTPHSLVVPAGDAVLKLNAPSHFEADHEAGALARWAGGGAVRLLARDDARRALLIERCRPGTTLWDARVDELPVVAALLPRLALEAQEPHPFRLLADESERWAEEVPRRYELHGRPFEHSLLEFAVDVFRSADRSGTWLVNEDLHGGNVLRAEREPWLVIDPKPLVGEPRARRRRAPVERDLAAALARRPRGARPRPRAPAGLGRRTRARLGLGREWVVGACRLGCARDPCCLALLSVACYGAAAARAAANSRKGV